MEIPFRGQIDLAVLRRMNRLVFTPSRRSMIVGGLFAALLVWGLLGVPLTQGGSLEGLMPVLVFLLLFVGILAYSTFMAPRKILESGKLLQNPVSGRITKHGVRIETPYSQADLPWDVFYKVRIGPDLVLLYQSLQISNVFPREFFASNADWQAFVDLVRQRVPLKPKQEQGMGRPVKKLLLWLVIFIVVVLLWNVFNQGR